MANKLVVAGALLLIVVIVAGGYLVYTTYFANGQVPSGSTPLGTPTPEPTGTGEATPPPSSGTTGTGAIWQSLLITNKDGSTYWVNPPKNFALQSLYGAPAGTTNFKQVATESNGVWVNLDPSVGTISAWQLSLTETVQIVDASGNLVGKLVDSAQVNAHGYSLATGTNQVLTSCGQIQAADVATLIGQVTSTSSGTHYGFEVIMSNIQLVLTTSNGQVTLSAPSPTPQNTLIWPIEFQ